MEIFLTLGLIGSFFNPHIALAQATTASTSPLTATTTPFMVLSPSSPISDRQEAWIDKLAICESGDRDYAINPKDLDGTASYSTFQFKVTTYKWLLDKYDILPAPIFSSTTQRAIVRRMINDPQINLKMQFPDCVRKLGIPPR